METFHTFHNSTAAREYRHTNGTGGWILVCDKTGRAILFPPHLSPTGILNHPFARGISGDLIGHG
jgi:hypothetical protein